MGKTRALVLLFAAVVSTQKCGPDLLVGTSCIIKLKTKNNEKPYEVKWVHDSRGGDILRWKDGKIKTIAEGLSSEDDRSLRFTSLRLNDTGKYTFYAGNKDGTEIGRGEVEIKVYEKAPKPTVTFICTPDGNATLTCDIGNRKDLTLSWYKDDKPIQNEKPQVLLSSIQVQENKPYSCEAKNNASTERSETVTASCIGQNLFIIFGIEVDRIMLSIIASGGALLLLLLCVLIICVCRSCHQRRKHQLDKLEVRLAELTPQIQTEH